MSSYEPASGRKSHELAAQALDGAVAGLAPPETNWRNLVPPPGWGQALGGGSGNIPWIALAASLVFAKPGSAAEREAIERLDEAERLSRTRWFFGEFGSWIYTGWTLLALATSAREVGQRGFFELASRLERLLCAWLALARLAAATCPPNGQVAAERQHSGRKVVVVCGMRSWGHSAGLGFAHHGLYRVAFGLEMSKARGKVGSFDGDWMSRVLHDLAPYLHGLARPLSQESPAELAARLVYSPVGACELRGYADGSRAFVIGRDEAGFVDEDANNNTPATLYMAIDVSRRELRYAPAWPAPNDGATRIRQQNVRADLDRSPRGGWVLRHSHVGERREGEWWVTDCPEPSSALVWSVLCRGGSEPWIYSTVGASQPSPQPAPPPAPGTAPTPAPPPPPPSGAAFDCRLVWYSPGECWVLEGRTEIPLVVERLPAQGEVPQRWLIRRA